MASLRTLALLTGALTIVACTRKGSGGTDQPAVQPGLSVSALAATSARDGSRFRRLAPGDSGIDFINSLEPENSKKYIYNGSGVAIGDYDGDGRPDVFLASLDGASRLFRQTAALKFEDVTAAAGVAGPGVWTTGASFADVDRDGDLDLFVCSLGAANRLYINRGNGTFVESAAPAGVDHVGASVMASFSDYDRDGDLDLYLLKNRVLHVSESKRTLKVRMIDGVRTTHPDFKEEMFFLDGHAQEAGEADILYQNAGDGTFTVVTESAGIADYAMGLSATWWDYNDDGWPDLYVANDMTTADLLYRNNRDGTFSDVINEVMPHTPWFAMGSDYGDINNDGKLDFLVGDMAARTHYKQKTQMGEMGSMRWFLESAEPRQYMRNALFLNSGTDRFMEVAFMTGLASTDWTWALRFADLDQDGWQDVFVTNGHARNANDGDMLAKYQALIAAGKKAEAFQIGFDLPKLDEPNISYRNRGDLSFEDVSSDWGLDMPGVSHGAAFADLDRDGDLDIVVNNLNANVAVYVNEGTDGHRLLIRLEGTRSDRFGVGARVTIHTAAGQQTRLLTLARGYLGADEPLIHFGLGAQTAVQKLIVDWPSGSRQVFVDVPADRLLTVTEPTQPGLQTPAPAAPKPLFEAADPGLDFVHAERAFDDYAREPLLPNQLSQLGPGLAFGDADGDGDEDLFVGGAAGQAGALYARDGAGRFALKTGPWARAAESEDMGVLWFDAEGDGDADLYVVSGGVEHDEGHAALRDRLYLNDGKGGFALAPRGRLPRLAQSGSAVVAADYDRDGDLDLFVGGRIVPGHYPQAPASHLLKNDGKRFVIAQAFEDAGMVTSAVWTDVDADGWIDLVVAGEWGPIRIYRNVEGQLKHAAFDSPKGWWNGLTAGDLDGDGDIDLVATNFGLNTKYHASPEKPAKLYVGDMDKDGRVDLVEATQEEGHEYPVRGLSCSSSAMPYIREQFPTFAGFAEATVDDLYADSLKEATLFEAERLEHMALFNDGTGKFEIKPLPRLSQASPAFGAAIADFTGDGQPDVVLAQNFFSPQPETGKMDGGLGLLLAGTGNGALEPMRADASGIVIADDGMGLAVSDLDGDGAPDIVIATNDGPLRVLRNASGRSQVTIRLRGQRGNPTAVGAGAVITTSTGRRVGAEVAAGSGYLSQSSPLIRLALSGAETIKSVDVRWPDGKTSRHDAPAGTTIELSAP